MAGTYPAAVAAERLAYVASVALVRATSWSAAACWAAVGDQLSTGAITMPSDMTVVPLTAGHVVEAAGAAPVEVDEPGTREPDAPLAMPAMPGMDVDPEPELVPEPELAGFATALPARRRGRWPGATWRRPPSWRRAPGRRPCRP